MVSRSVADSETLSGADALLNQLMANGVETIFGLPGGQLDHFFDSMFRADKAVNVFASRHEQGAAYMAFGYARSTGKPGVYVVVPGPGVLNTTAALCSAWATNAPVLCLTGQIPSEGLGKGIGYLHELPDQLGTLKSLTKWADRIMQPADAPRAVNRAFSELRNGRPRPVALEMPMDVMGLQAQVELLPPEAGRTIPAVDTDEIERAAQLIKEADAPMIVVGGGAADAPGEVLELAERTQAPVVSFRNGRGVVSDRHYLSQNLPAGHTLWSSADLVIGIGTRMEMQYLHWGMPPHMKVVRIDIDPEELSRHGGADVDLLADAKSAVAGLNQALSAAGHNARSRKQELEALKDRVAQQTAVVQPQMDYLKAIRRALPDDGFFVDEITQVGYASWYGFPVYEPRHLVGCGYQGTLGFGYATALGVKVAHPDKPVVNIAGDGGFMFTANEMATAAHYGIPLVTVLFNNNKYYNVQRQQKEWFGGRVIASDLTNPDFVRFAESFGIDATRVKGPDDLQTAIRAGLDRGRPTLIEVPTTDMASPWPFIMQPRLFPADPS